jgi:2,4-dienoyl-CoA reductase-like NADH-dependent reductase (Old Yellow Enzyme family)
MCQYSADDGMANDWHFVHLGRFALGGAGIVMVEATAVTKDGRITHGDMGLWSDAHIAPLARIATFLRNHGAVPAIQLAHAGRKASMQRPWFGNGPLNADDFLRGETPWDVVAPSAIPLDEGWITPHALTQDELAGLRDAYRAAVERNRGDRACRLACGKTTIRAHFLRRRTRRRLDDRRFRCLRARIEGARRRCDRLLVGWAHRLGDGGAHSARLRLPAAVRRAHP